MQGIVAPPMIEVGKIKTVERFGPKYEVGEALRPLDDGDWIIEITLLETGEKVEYRWTQMIDDPDAY